MTDERKKYTFKDVYGFVEIGLDGEQSVCVISGSGPIFDKMIEDGVIYPVVAPATDPARKKTLREPYERWAPRMRKKSKIKRKKYGPLFRWDGMSSANGCVVRIGPFLLRRPGCGINFWRISHWPRDISYSEFCVWRSDQPTKVNRR